MIMRLFAGILDEDTIEFSFEFHRRDIFARKNGHAYWDPWRHLWPSSVDHRR
jgi:hypothetical protein